LKELTLVAEMMKSLLVLENGDRLTREEFERRYDAMPHLKKAELIDGVVYLAAALRYRRHGRPHSLIMGWLVAYEALTQGVQAADNATVRLDNDNEPQPDALLRVEADYGGQSCISEDDYIEGAPELIVEIAASTASYDLHDKLEVYRRHGVQEYIVWRVLEQQLDWFYLDSGHYILLQPNAFGVLCSRVFPGLNLDMQALLQENVAQVLAEVQLGKMTEVHQNFVQKLAQTRSQR
jgi:Uma2 family endonuclease